MVDSTDTAFDCLIMLYYNAQILSYIAAIRDINMRTHIITKDGYKNDRIRICHQRNDAHDQLLERIVA
jgi:hypothetical protein